MRIWNIVVTKNSKLLWIKRISSKNRMMKSYHVADYSQLVKILSRFLIMGTYFPVANEYSKMLGSIFSLMLISRLYLVG